MRETRQSGSEGGVAFRAIPTPIVACLNPRCATVVGGFCVLTASNRLAHRFVQTGTMISVATNARFA